MRELSETILCYADKTIENSISEFLESLTIDAIQEVIVEFEDGLKGLQHSAGNFSVGNMQTTSQLCGAALEAIQLNPAADSTALSIVKFWQRFDDMTSMAIISSISSRSTKALVMYSSWTLWDWITTTVHETVQGGHQKTWVSLLVDDVRSVMQRISPNLSRILNPKKYLPHISGAAAYTIPSCRPYSDRHRLNDFVEKAVIEAIQRWLNFPCSALTITQNSLIGTLMQCQTSAILYLDVVWKMYQNPKKYVIHGHPRQQESQPHTKTVLQQFHQQFKSHDLMDNDSNISKHLDYFDSLIELWAKKASVKLAPAQRRKRINDANSNIPNAPNSVSIIFVVKAKANIFEQENLPILLESGRKLQRDTFVTFLQDFYPLITDGFAAHKNSSNKHIKKMAEKPDRFLPFRSLAPSMQNALATIYSDMDRLRTPAGLFNMAAFRGVFFNTDYSQKHLRWFDSIIDWEAYRDSLKIKNTERNRKKAKAQIEKYFVKKNAYGTWQPKITTALLYNHSNVADDLWLEHLRKNPDLDIYSFFKFFKAKLSFVGDLASLLIVGDLITCGFLPMPTPQDFGMLVAKINKGGVKGLKRLGLLPPNPTLTDISDAFVTLHNHVEQALDEDTRNKMGYNVVVLEHSLCKYQRVYPLRTKNGSKPRKKKTG